MEIRCDDEQSQINSLRIEFSGRLLSSASVTISQFLQGDVQANEIKFIYRDLLLSNSLSYEIEFCHYFLHSASLNIEIIHNNVTVNE